MKKDSLKSILGGAVAGLLNGFFGAGGGMAAVPALTALKVERKKAHASSVAVILPLSAFSACVYLLNGTVTFGDAKDYLLPGMIGAGLGALTLKKFSPTALKKIFGGFAVWAGIRLLLK